MVCKGGLIRHLASHNLPFDIILNLFSRIGLFNHTTLLYEQANTLLMKLSEMDSILPNTVEFHTDLIENINKSAPLSQKQQYLSFIPQPLHQFFLSTPFRQSFSVCKGGFTRFLLSAQLPIELIIRIFSRAELFGKSGITPDLENCFSIRMISDIYLITPTTPGFHLAILEYQKNAIDQHQIS